MMYEMIKWAGEVRFCVCGTQKVILSCVCVAGSSEAESERLDNDSEENVENAEAEDSFQPSE